MSDSDVVKFDKIIEDAIKKARKIKRIPPEEYAAILVGWNFRLKEEIEEARERARATRSKP